jgi:hypothetical protein
MTWPMEVRHGLGFPYFNFHAMIHASVGLSFLLLLCVSK